MKKYIICISLISCSTLTVMNNADQKPVQFAPAPILFNRLDAYDKKYKSKYAQLALHSRLHDVLGNRSWSRTQAGNFITLCVEEHISNLSESQKTEHKQTIMNILRPEPVPDKPAKL